jgi:farnesyl diphosphate synthase
MTFVERLTTAAERVEERLRRLLDECAPGAQTRLGGAMRHAVLAGGKRFRPFLVMESAALFGVPAEVSVDAAAAFECIHCYSLVHDDLPCMDDDDLRRGQPTVHKAYDEWTAVLAGDGLLTLAFEILARQAEVDASVRAELALLLARASGGMGMVGGQMLDLEAEKRSEPANPTPEHVRRLQSLKTGALIASACEAGPVLANAPAQERATLRQFGEELGFAFQIADDLLDVLGDAATVGKATGKDTAAGKATLVGLLGTDAARTALAAAERKAISMLRPFGERAEPLIAATQFAVNRVH